MPASLRWEESIMKYEIDEIRKVPIGGVGQKIHIRGEKRSKDVCKRQAYNSFVPFCRARVLSRRAHLF